MTLLCDNIADGTLFYPFSDPNADIDHIKDPDPDADPESYLDNNIDLNPVTNCDHDSDFDIITNRNNHSYSHNSHYKQCSKFHIYLIVIEMAYIFQKCMHLKGKSI